MEDDRFNRRLYRDLLESEGLEVVTAGTAIEGVRLAREHPPDVVVMDLEMPGRSGLAATRELKGDPRTAHVPVVIVSAHALLEHEQRALEVADYFLRKPLRFPDFQELLKTLLAPEDS